MSEQDQSGLVDLDSASPAFMTALLCGLGLAQGQTAEMIAAVDFDNGTRFVRRALIERTAELKRPFVVLSWDASGRLLLPCPTALRGADDHRWADSGRLPFMVSIAATFRPGEPREWREVSAFLPASACVESL